MTILKGIRIDNPIRNLRIPHQLYENVEIIPQNTQILSSLGKLVMNRLYRIIKSVLNGVNSIWITQSIIQTENERAEHKFFNKKNRENTFAVSLCSTN